MKLSRALLTCIPLFLISVAHGADFPAKAGAIRTHTTVAFDNDGKDYRVTLTLTEQNADGSVTKLPGIGITCPFGSSGKTGEIIKDDSLRVQLETDSKAGQKDVHCIVSVTARDMEPVQSEFTLTLP